MKNITVLTIIMFSTLLSFSSICAEDFRAETLNPVIKPSVTFIELGSKSCIPCRMMQPVMQAVERKFGPQLKVIFYDVSRDEHRRYTKLYSIRIIPTQVFLNNAGNEFFRHEGFFSEADITRILKSQGLKPLNNN